MTTPSDLLPAYAKIVRHSGSWLRLWWLDKVLRMAIKRSFRYDADIPFLRAKQAALDLKTSKIDPQMDVQAIDCNGASAEWLTLPESSAERIVVYIHGGGWMFKFPRLHHAMLAKWCRRLSARALMVDYRLAPEYPFPAGLDDVWSAWQWLLAEGISPKNVIVAGDSAGGNLTLALLQRIKAAGEAMPACAIMLSPFVDFTLSSPSMVTNEKRDPMFSVAAMVGMRRHYIAPENMLAVVASPLFANFSGLPPLFFQASDSEMLRDDSLRAAAAAHAAGVAVEVELWDKVPHVFQAFPELTHSAAALETVADFVERHANWGTPALGAG